MYLIKLIEKDIENNKVYTSYFGKKCKLVLNNDKNLMFETIEEAKRVVDKLFKEYINNDYINYDWWENTLEFEKIV